MRIAFFGGTFDPPHQGHVRIAQAAADRLHLDRVLLAPVALQPLKRDATPASFADRLAMLQLLVADARDPRFAVTEIDAPRHDGRPNYTYDTLLRLRDSLDPEDQLYVLLGADSFLSMRRWHRAPELLLLARWIIATRPGFELQRLDQQLPENVHPTAPTQHPGYLEQQLSVTLPGSTGTTALYLLTDMREDVSATEIRTALAIRTSPAELDPLAPGQQELPAEHLLAPAVLAYIRDRGLYR